jgi:conjugative transfer signal peptidase TraF
MALRALPLTAASVAILGLFVPQSPRFVWNSTASAPVGLYALSRASELKRGDLVLAEPPIWARAFAARRGYLPLHVPLVKRIAALAGDQVCNAGRRVSINGQMVATRLPADAHHRPLPAWHGCHELGRDEVFLLMTERPGSFDGRYFGTVRRGAITGTLRPIWLP